MWYLPMSVGPIPWLWRRVMRQTNETAAESAREAADKIAAAIDAGGEDGQHSVDSK